MSDLEPPQPPSEPPATASRPREPVPWWKRRWLRVPTWGWIALGVVVLLVAAAAAGGGSDDETVSTSEGTGTTTLPGTTTAGASSTEVATTVATTASVSSLPATTTTTATTVAPTTVPTTPPTAPPTAPPTTLPGFGNGTHLVGTDIQPGRYLAAHLDGCSWARLKDASGSLDAIIANDNAAGQAIVDIAATDALFESSDCGAGP